MEHSDEKLLNCYKVAKHYGMTDAQGAYYREACRRFGLITVDDMNKAVTVQDLRVAGDVAAGHIKPPLVPTGGGLLQETAQPSFKDAVFTWEKPKPVKADSSLWKRFVRWLHYWTPK